jgi:sulfite exporter TauE/SafE
MEASYVLAFMTGLAGGFGHCIGMCGPLIGTFSLRDSSLTIPGRFLAQLLYHSGRILTYGFIGALMGFAGSFVNVAGTLVGIQNGVMIAAGTVMVLMGLAIAGIAGGTGWLERYNRPVLRAAGTVLEGTSLGRYLPLGLLLGFLPCGLSYTIFVAAAGAGDPLAGLALALAFGIGTVPALVLFGVVVGYLGTKLRGAVQRAGGVVVIIMGAHFIVKGIRLYAQM